VIEMESALTQLTHLMVGLTDGAIVQCQPTNIRRPGEGEGDGSKDVSWSNKDIKKDNRGGMGGKAVKQV